MNHPTLGLHKWVFATILALVAALAFVILVASFQYYFGADAPTDEDLTKMQILEQLEKDSQNLNINQKEAAIGRLEEMSTNSDSSLEAKFEILDALNSEQ